MRFAGLILAIMLAVSSAAKVVHMSASGSDAGDGSIRNPYATLPAAYKAIEAGDTFCVRGGRFYVDDSQVMKIVGSYACVFALDKAGTAERRTCVMGYPGERPVFDFSALQMEDRIAPVCEALKLPETVIPLCTIVIGHPAEQPEPKDKWKPENVSYNEFGGNDSK